MTIFCARNHCVRFEYSKHRGLMFLIILSMPFQASEAGYYFMPNFEPMREGLKKRGVLTGQQMCDFFLQVLPIYGSKMWNNVSSLND